MEQSFPVTEKVMDMINRYTIDPLKPEDVFCFSLTLCDNDIDRDNERFSDRALSELAKLFVGKTGIFDHDPTSSGQTARIFSTALVTDDTRLTLDGKPYTALTAKAYMVKTSSNADLIKEINGGIKKEVSVSCAVSKHICSVCGCDKTKQSCSHIKGRYYGEKLCFVTLEEPTDAYEWSFVAVPAQQNAGVTKRHELAQESSKQLAKLKNRLGDASKKLSAAAEHIKGEILKLSYFCTPFYTADQVQAMTEEMDIYRLLELRKKLENFVQSHSRQLMLSEKSFVTAPEKDDEDLENENYTI